MTRFPFLMTVAAAGAAYLSVADRKSSLALNIVEVETNLGAPLWLILGGLAVASVALNKLTRRPRPEPASMTSSGPASRPAPKRDPLPNSPSRASIGPEDDWLQSIIDSAKNIDLPSGARMTHKPEGTTPFELFLEHAPPERCRRSVTAVAQWLATVPLPPRIRIHFKNCPEGGSPRHHQVAGAIASVMPRGSFKVTSGLDSVDVQFLHADPLWTSQPQLS